MARVPLHPRCPSRVAPVKDTREPGSALQSGRSFYFIYVQLTSARAAGSLEPGRRARSPPSTSLLPPRLLLHGAKHRGAARAPG